MSKLKRIYGRIFVAEDAEGRNAKFKFQTGENHPCFSSAPLDLD